MFCLISWCFYCIVLEKCGRCTGVILQTKVRCMEIWLLKAFGGGVNGSYPTKSQDPTNPCACFNILSIWKAFCTCRDWYSNVGMNINRCNPVGNLLSCSLQKRPRPKDLYIGALYNTFWQYIQIFWGWKLAYYNIRNFLSPPTTSPFPLQNKILPTDFFAKLDIIK